MPRPTAIPMSRSRYIGPNSCGRRLLVAVGIPIIIWLILMASSRLVRLYSLAYLGNSQAMCELAIEYYTTRGDLVRENVYRGDYWIRKAAAKGNIHAIKIIIIGWEHSNNHEVIYWLQHGSEQNKIPWCAEQLAAAYADGRFGLSRDVGKTGKAREYDNLAVELHRNKGTLKNHNCVLLPWVNPSAWPQPVPKEIHPGIPWESVSKK